MDILIPQSVQQLIKEHGEENVVFKSCGNFVVVMKKLEDTKTNEHRTKNNYPLFAKHRANKLYVLFIVNKMDENITINEITNTFFEKKKVYKVNEIVMEEEFDNNIEQVCSTGIHYFKSYVCAFYYRFVDYNKNCTGKYIGWYDNGQMMWNQEY